MKKVVIFVNGPLVFKEVSPLAFALNKVEDFQVELLINYGNGQFDQMVETATENNIHCIMLKDNTLYDEGDVLYNPKNTFLSLLTRFFYNAYTARLGSAILSFKKMADLKLQIKHLLLKKKYDLIIVSHGSGVGFISTLVALAEKYKIPTIGYPYCIIGALPARIHGLYHRNRLVVDACYANIVRYIAPNYVYNFEQKKLLPVDLKTFIFGLILRILPNNPWSYFDDKLNAIAVHDDFMRHDLEFYYKISPNKITITGKILEDVTYRTLASSEKNKDIILRKLNLDTNKKIVLISSTTFFLHGYSTFEEEIDALGKVINLFSGLEHVQTLVSFRKIQSTYKNSYQKLATNERIRLFFPEEATIEELIALCDIFISGLTSVLGTAVACHKPSIILDYGIWDQPTAHPLYMWQYKSLVRAKDISELQRIAYNTINDSTFHRNILNKQEHICTTLSKHFDGQAESRLIALAKKICNNHHAS